MRTRTGAATAAPFLTAPFLTAPFLTALLLAAGCSTQAHPAVQPGQFFASMGGNAVTFLRTRVTPGDAGTVLTDGTGYTLYWFSADTPASSACDAACVPQWPPVTGAPKAAPGVRLQGSLGTIIRPDGVVQATYDGHPLYTFVGDFDPGDAAGNDVVQFGGTWHAVHPAR
jgi:predicted lipoprotein with Yx(FWY)xxD motif